MNGTSAIEPSRIQEAHSWVHPGEPLSENFTPLQGQRRPDRIDAVSLGLALRRDESIPVAPAALTPLKCWVGSS